MAKDKDYDQSYFQKREVWFTEFKALLFSLVFKLFLRPKTLLDVGCAEGKLVKWAMRLGIKSSGVDISEERFKKAPVFIQQQCQKADILNLPFKDKQFELVSSLAVLEHIDKKDTSRAINELLRVSRKYVFLQVCVKDNPMEGEHYLLDPTHVNVEESGWWVKKFRELKIKTKFAFPRLGVFLLEKADKGQ